MTAYQVSPPSFRQLGSYLTRAGPIPAVWRMGRHLCRFAAKTFQKVKHDSGTLFLLVFAVLSWTGVWSTTKYLGGLEARLLRLLSKKYSASGGGDMIIGGLLVDMVIGNGEVGNGEVGNYGDVGNRSSGIDIDIVSSGIAEDSAGVSSSIASAEVKRIQELIDQMGGNGGKHNANGIGNLEDNHYLDDPEFHDSISARTNPNLLTPPSHPPPPSSPGLQKLYKGFRSNNLRHVQLDFIWPRHYQPAPDLHEISSMPRDDLRRLWDANTNEGGSLKFERTGS
jgi:hypothetical protein